jgi:hypothetical protein
MEPGTLEKEREAELERQRQKAQASAEFREAVKQRLRVAKREMRKQQLEPLEEVRLAHLAASLGAMLACNVLLCVLMRGSPRPCPRSN